jgi:hypothetical protein
MPTARLVMRAAVEGIEATAEMIDKSSIYRSLFHAK